MVSTRARAAAGPAAPIASVAPPPPPMAAPVPAKRSRTPKADSTGGGGPATPVAAAAAAAAAAPAKRRAATPATGSATPIAAAVAAPAPAKRSRTHKADSKKGGAEQASSPGDGMRSMERALYATGCKLICGVDEAGRGPLAGPVVAAACYIPPGVFIAGIADSKVLSEAAREVIYAELMAHPEVKTSVSIQPPSVIDKINILQATMLAMRECVHQLRELEPALDYVLVDGNRAPFDQGKPGIEDTGIPGVRCEAVVKGDAKISLIAAASIVAKVTRDRVMLDLDQQYPQYEFKQHKGYPTAKHVALLTKHGACIEHRKTFAPVRNVLSAEA
ncbi:ribonuclease H-like domain-containing protein [Pavlovales sp. CCMP2436]|nr:ribonuclease H-like domain-containing protein [Pavlovales sp. CCMP2436]